MEPLSAAANSLAVVSVAFQLTEACVKLYRFWESIEDAPHEIAVIKEDLQYLISVFRRVKSNEDPSDSCVAEGVHHCRVKVMELMAIIEKFDVGFQSSSRKTRVWTAFKAATHSKHVQRFRDSLNETKVTLMLALIHESVVHARARRFSTNVNMPKSLNHSNSTGTMRHAFTGPNTNRWTQVHEGHSKPMDRRSLATAPTRKDFLAAKTLIYSRQCLPQQSTSNFQMQELMLQTIAQTTTATFESTSLEIFAQDSYTINAYGQIQAKTLAYAERLRHRVSHKASSFRTALGCVWLRTTTLYLIDNHEDTAEKSQTITSFVFYPTAWLKHFGARAGLEAVVAFVNRSWQFNFRLTVTSAIPEDSLIFELCRTGQTRAVEILLSKRLASVVDTSPNGWKPLHFAAAAGHVDLCAMLIRAGADKAALVYKGPSESVLSPISLFVACSSGLHAEAKIAMLRLFWDCIDLASSTSDGWNVHDWLKRAYASERVPVSQNSITWLLTMTANEEYIECGPRHIWSALQHAVRSILTHERHNRCLERVLELSEGDYKNLNQQHVDALSSGVALRVSGQMLLPMITYVGSFHQMKGFDLMEDNISHREFLRAQPKLFAAWCHAVIDAVKNLERSMRQELEICIQQFGWAQNDLIKALSCPQPNNHSTDTQGLPQQICTHCKGHFGALECILVEPARIAITECAKTGHHSDCVCQSLYQNNMTPDEILDYAGMCLSDHDGYESDPNEEFFDAHPHLFDTSSLQIQGIPDMFSNVATLLYKAQGRTWMGAYAAGERFCATCLLLKEHYIGEDGLTAEFPPMPESFRSLRVTR